jgi:putative toxin-antitoxin system antitoxin component (TIGR02293 family)
MATAATRLTRARPAKAASKTTRPRRSGLERFREFLGRGRPGPHHHVVLLGLDTFNPRELLQVVSEGLPYSAFAAFRANTSMPVGDVLLLLDIPSRTLTRRKQEGRFRHDESDRLMRASRVFARALALFEGDRDAAMHWLLEPQKAFGGERPLVLARTELGALEVERLIGRLEHGVFT